MASELTTTSAEKPDAEEADGGDFHKEAMARYDAAWLRDRENVLEGYEDLKFLSSGDEQWPQDVRAQRVAEGRPCISENRLPQFVRQITGDIRQRRATAKVVPVDSRGDPETARIREGIHRYIENRSMAQAVYFQGADQQVQGGRGAWRVETEYASETTMDQEIRVSPIEDGLSVLCDPDAILPCKTDGMFKFVPVDLSIAKFKKKYPGKATSAIGGEQQQEFQGWYGEDYIRVAEYWFKEPTQRTLLVGNGRVMDLTDEPEEKIAQAQQMVALAAQAGLELRIEKREGFKVRRAVISGSEVLEEPTDFPGPYIPIVVCDGEEVRIGRKVVRHGAIRHARDPQRRLNYYISADTEVTALQPKAPFIGTEKNFEEFEDEWETANQENRPFLRYTPDPANGNAAPSRVQPPVSSQGILRGIELATAGLQATTGIYNASLGAQSNETSGKAIKARQSEGDTGTYVYVEKYGQAVEHTHRIISGLIPHVYDTAREMRIVGADGKEELAKINQPAGLAIEGEGGPVQNDVTVDAYDIVFEMGPSYNSQREEAREGMQAFMQAIGPEAAIRFADLFAKMQDWPLADEVAERTETLLPPEVRAAMAQKNGEPPQPPPPPSPEVIAQQQQQQLDAAKMQAELRKLDVQTQLDLKKLQAEGAKIEAEMQRSQLDAEASNTKARVDVFKAQVDHHKASLDHQKALREEQALPEGDGDRLAGLEQGVAGIAQATAEALMPAFQAILQQLQQIALALAPPPAIQPPEGPAQ